MLVYDNHCYDILDYRFIDKLKNREYCLHKFVLLSNIEFEKMFKEKHAECIMK